MEGIMALFGRSPFRPTQNHMEAVLRCVALIEPLAEAVCQGDRAELHRVCREIGKHENEADEIKHEIRDRLPKALFLPVDRRDLLEIVHLQDSIADSLEEACHLLTLKALTLPDDLHADFRALAAELVRTCQAAGEVIQHLDDLVQTSFGGREAERVLAMIEEIDEPETRAEELVRSVVRQLFAQEGDLGALDTMLWYQFLTQLGQTGNYAERTVSRVRLLIAKA